MNPGRAAKAALESLPPALRPLGEALLPALLAAVREELGVDPLVDVALALPVPARRAHKIARSGAIAGVRKVGRRWVARESAINAWLAAHCKSPPILPRASSDDFEDLRASLRGTAS